MSDTLQIGHSPSPQGIPVNRATVGRGAATGEQKFLPGDFIAGNAAAGELHETIHRLTRLRQAHEALLAERAAAVRSLRQLCEEFGDNDWPDNLHLADVIENHLAGYLQGDE